jgi:hypothetical protein
MSRQVWHNKDPSLLKEVIPCESLEVIKLGGPESEAF